ncbi:MAG: GDP-L-fucose synthase [Gammaproteobacteria bacterium]|nr:GDP-L-fucose synthase [Gammaproteobacteria bacterium]
MEPNSRVYVAGHAGLVGSALVRALEQRGFASIITRTRKELDLRDASAVRTFFDEEAPEYVLLAAARVGGIHANNAYPADFIRDNLQIQTNVIHESWRHGVKRLLFLGSSCIYPKHAPQPMREEHLLTGPLEPTNRPYALAKIAGIEMCWSYNRQHGTRYLAAMPTNLYGPGDNFDLQNAHVVPALMHRMHLAKLNDEPEVVVWGSGTPLRELMHSDDLADCCLTVLSQSDERYLRLLEPVGTDGEACAPLLNMGSGQEYTIAELAAMVREVVGYAGGVHQDRSKPDGTPRKCMDSSRVRNLGWSPQINLRVGLEGMYRAFLAHGVSASKASQRSS